MHRILPLAGASVLVALALALPASAQNAPSDQDLVRSALAAAPAAIREGAAVVEFGGRTLKEGTNGWTCFPDVPDTPGTDPMCLDATFLAWADAWQKHEAPSATTVGLAYMLSGGSDASNTDPYATEPAAGEDWVDSGPHVMIVVPDPAMLAGLSTDPASGGPYVMWKGTPYAHVMVPVGARPMGR